MLVYLLIASISAVIAFFCSKIIILVINILIIPGRRNTCIRENNYKSVVATRISKYENKDVDGHYHLVYEYEIDGKTRTIAVNSTIYGDTQIELYYINDSNYAVANIADLGDKELGISKESKRNIFFAAFAVFFVFIVLFWKLY